MGSGEGLISGIIPLLANRRAYDLGGLITRGALTWDFTVFYEMNFIAK